MQEDKIFNNTYGEQDATEHMISFNVSHTYGDNMDSDDKIHYKILFSKVDELLAISETLQEFDAYPVSSAVNSSRENRSSLTDPVPLEIEQVLW